MNYYSAKGTGALQAAIASASTVGTSTGSLLYFSETKNWKNGPEEPYYGVLGGYSSYDTAYPDAYTETRYDFIDGPVQREQELTNRDGTSVSTTERDREGHVTEVEITGGCGRGRSSMRRTRAARY